MQFFVAFLRGYGRGLERFVDLILSEKKSSKVRWSLIIGQVSIFIESFGVVYEFFTVS